MIYTAIEALKEKDGSSKRAISKHIEHVYRDQLPDSGSHQNLLTHHLKRLKSEGLLPMIKNSYIIPRSTPLPPPSTASPSSRPRGRPRKNVNDVAAAPVAVVVAGRGRGGGRGRACPRLNLLAQSFGKRRPVGRPKKGAKGKKFADEDSRRKLEHFQSKVKESHDAIKPYSGHQSPAAAVVSIQGLEMLATLGFKAPLRDETQQPQQFPEPQLLQQGLPSQQLHPQQVPKAQTYEQQYLQIPLQQQVQKLFQPHTLVTMKKKKSLQQIVEATHSDLPDECWEYIFRFMVVNDLNHIKSLSLVSKQFLSITNSLVYSLTVKDATVPLLERLLKRFTNLTSLHLNDRIDLDMVLWKISSFPLKKLTSLYISCLHIFPFPANGLRVFSKKITTLTSLDCSHSFLRNNDLLLIAECFPLLEKLNINHPFMIMLRHPMVTNTSTDFMNGVYSLLSKCKFIQHLDLNGAYFLNDQHVAELSLSCAGLKSINLSFCYDLTELSLFSLVRNCPSLSEIKMVHTSIGKEIAGSSNSLRNFVVGSPELKSLCLARCQHLNDENIISFASIFPNLEQLDLSHCNQISEGLCQVLRISCKIRHLNLSGCSIVKLLEINFVVPKLEVLDLSNTKVDDEILYVISKNFSGLLELLLNNCDDFTEEGVKRVAEKCTQLTKIYFGDFVISNENREFFSRQGCLVFKYYDEYF